MRTLWIRRKAIIKELATLREELARIDTTLGLDDVMAGEHVQGTNACDWKCKKCGTAWVASVRMPCEKCRPDSANSMFTNETR